MRKTKVSHRLLSLALTLALFVSMFGGVTIPTSAEGNASQQSNQSTTIKGKTYSYPALFGDEQGENGFSYYTGVSVDALEPAVYQNNVWTDAAPLNTAGEAFQMAGNGAIVPGNGKVAALGYKITEDGVLSADVIYTKVGNDDIDISRWENAYANGVILSVIHKKADGQVELYTKEVKTLLFARNKVAFQIPETAVAQGDEILFVIDSNPLGQETGSTGTASNWKDGGYLDLTIHMTEEGHNLPVGKYDLTNATAHSWPGAWVGEATKVSEVPAQFAHGTDGFSHYISAPRWNGSTWNTGFDPIKDNFIYLNNSYTMLSNGTPTSNGLTTHIPRYFNLAANGYFCPGQYGENAVVSYTAEEDGTLILDWKITNEPGANQTEVWHMLGYQVHIYKNTEKIYTKAISNTATKDVHEIKLDVDVVAGDKLYFAIDPDNGEMAGAADGSYNWTGYGIDWSDNGYMDLSILAVEKNAERSDDSSLSSIEVDGNAVPNFNSDVFHYSAPAAETADKVAVKVATNHIGATILINGEAAESGVAFDVTGLQTGLNTVEIEVVAEDGLTMTVYQLDVVCQAESSEPKGKTYSYPALFGDEQGKNGFSYYTGVSVDALEPAVYQNGIWVDAAPMNNAGEKFQIAGNGAIVPGNGKVAALGYKITEDGVLSADVIYTKVGNDDIDISRWENAYANGVILSVIHKKADGQVELYTKEVKTLLFARNKVAFQIPETAVAQGDEILFVIDSNPLGQETGSTGTASNWKDGGYLDLTIHMTEEGHNLPVGKYDLTNATAHSWPGAWVGEATKVSEVPAQFAHGTDGFSHYISAPRWNGSTWNTGFDPIKDNFIYLNNSYTMLSNGTPTSNGLTTHIPRYFNLAANGYFCPGQYGENAVVSYTAEEDGTLILDWKITNEPGANQTEVWHMLGYQVHIYKNTEKIYTKAISNTATKDVHEIKLDVDVVAGDKLYFAIDPDNGEMAGAADGSYNWTGYGIDWSDNGYMDLSILAVEKNAERSDDSSLSSIEVGGEVISGYNPDVHFYAFTIDENTSSLAVKPVVNQAGATVFVNGEKLAAGATYDWTNLRAGINYLTIEVVAEDGLSNTVYNLEVLREGSDNADLSGLSVIVGESELITSFASDKLAYLITVPHGTTTVTLKATSSSLTATMTLNGETLNSNSGVQAALTGEENKLTVVVTAQDGVSTKTYEVTVTVLPPLSDDATLHGLTVFGATLSPVFAPDTIEYATTVDTDIVDVTLEASCHDKAELYVNDALTASGDEVKVRLAIGENTITIKVVAENGSEKTYTLVVTRKAPAFEENKLHLEAEDAELNKCVVYRNFANATNGLCAGEIDHLDSWVKFTANIEAAGKYVMTVRYSAGIAGGAEHSVHVNGVLNAENFVAPMNAWDSWDNVVMVVDLKEGANTIQFTKLAGYAAIDWIELSPVPANTNAKLDGIEVDGYELNATFKPETIEYTLSKTVTNSLLKLKLTAQEEDAVISVNGTKIVGGKADVLLKYGENVIEIQVTAPDFKTILTYKLHCTYTPAVEEGVLHLEAENAELNNCKVYNGFVNATNGLCAGEIDYLDSWVKFTANMDKAGKYILTVRYSAGFEGGAEHTVHINDVLNAESLVVPMNGWDTWNNVVMLVDLKEGVNTIQLTKLKGYAAIDWIELAAVPANNNAKLENLSVEGFDIKFDQKTLEYKLTEEMKDNKLVLNLSAEEEDAVIRVNGVVVTEGAYTAFLQVGDNCVEIEVTAPDYQTKLTYKINYSYHPAAQDGKLKLEMESAKLNNCVVYGDFKNASGGFCVGKMDHADSTAEISFEVSKAGLYKVVVAYTAGFGDATGLVRLGDGDERELIFKKTEDWDYFAETSFVIELKQGTNTLRFRKANGFSSLDYIIIEKASAHAAVPQYYEAEDATLNNCVAYEDFNFASNGLCAGMIDYSDSYVEFKVNVATKGSYRMGIRYSTGFDTNPTMYLGINGAKGVLIMLPRISAWDDWYTIYVTVELEAGENVIRLQKGDGYAAIDYINLLLSSLVSDSDEPALRLPTVGTPFNDSVSPSKKAPESEQKPPVTQPQQPQTPIEVEADTTWYAVLMLVLCSLCVIGTAALYVVAFARDKKRRQGV